VFGRSKATQTADSAPQPTAKAGGKGRPTPSRREAEARNRHPVVGSPQLRADATKEERKAAKQAQRQSLAMERAKAREAMLTGDEKHLPARDQGPAKRFARDYVDARRSLGEYMLPAALVILAMSIFRVPVLQFMSIFLLYGLVLIIAVDAFLLRRRVTKLAVAKFGDKATGVGGYAMMRSLQMRRTRMPRPMVQRGQFPS
jgi:Protein of unknown function (DUF3043)